MIFKLNNCCLIEKLSINLIKYFLYTVIKFGHRLKMSTTSDLNSIYFHNYNYQNNYNCPTQQQQYYEIHQEIPKPSTSKTTTTPIVTSNTKTLFEKTLLSAKQEICQICSSTVSVGLHFGAVTCEACKKFFVRFINNQDSKPICKRKSGDCVITLKTRADCFHCRLKKCIHVGMSVESK
jgi:hypothetical protein